jgi:hypothetical protein
VSLEGVDRIGDRRDLVQERDELRAECAALEAKVESLEAANKDMRADLDRALRIIGEQGAQLRSQEGGRWQTIEKAHPPRGGIYEVLRQGVKPFIAEVCYGTHSPWWVVAIDTANTFPMDDSDRWRPWSSKPEAGASQEGGGGA